MDSSESGRASVKRVKVAAEFLGYALIWALLVGAPIIWFTGIRDWETQNSVGMLGGMTGALFVPLIVPPLLAIRVGARLAVLLHPPARARLVTIVIICVALATVLAPVASRGTLLADPASQEPTSYDWASWILVGAGSLVAAGLIGVAFGLRQANKPPRPMTPRATAAYCSECGSWVWVAASGGCQNGHAPRFLSGHYLAPTNAPASQTNEDPAAAVAKPPMAL